MSKIIDLLKEKNRNIHNSCLLGKCGHATEAQIYARISHPEFGNCISTTTELQYFIDDQINGLEPEDIEELSITIDFLLMTQCEFEALPQV